MADNEQPDQNANTTEAEGERGGSDDRTVRNADRDEAPEQLYEQKESGNTAGGVSNRPLDEEITNHEALPGRNTRK